MERGYTSILEYCMADHARQFTGEIEQANAVNNRDTNCNSSKIEKLILDATQLANEYDE